MTRQSRQDRTQAIIDAFYKANGPCCAGCDWWRWHNSIAGEFIKTAPTSGSERFAMLGATSYSLSPGAGHIMTLRNHVCGKFKDEPDEHRDAQVDVKPLTRCAANRDGECGHPQCPQLRDNEPRATGRHCPLDIREEED